MTDASKDANGDGQVDLSERIAANEKAIAELGATVAKLSEAGSGVDTSLDALDGKLDALEKTVKAMGDALATLAPGKVADTSGELAEIKSCINDFHKRIFGDPLFVVPPVSEPVAE